MNDRFLRVCRGQPVDRSPVWLMRQAGRYLPQYREVRQRVDFLTLCKTPDLAAEVTVQPVDILGVDAAIVFADILLPLDAMGAGLRFLKGDGPSFERPVRRRQDLAELKQPDVDNSLGYVFEALRVVRRALDGRVPLIGFGGTPWTLAAYLVEGGVSKQFHHLLAWSYNDPQGLAQLLDRVALTSVEYLTRQVEAGAQALQLFDTWGGLLDRERWRTLARPAVEKIIDGLGSQVPLIFYINGGGHLLEELKDLPVDVLSVDWRIPLSQVRRIVGNDKVLQGNFDPAALLGPIPEIERQAAALLEEGGGPGSRAGGNGHPLPHIVNLGHGILPMTPPENAQAFVTAVQRLSQSAGPTLPRPAGP